MNNGKKNIGDLFQVFIKSEQSAGVTLIVFAFLSLILCNFVFGNTWFEFWEHHVGPENLGLNLSLMHWVNDGLMTIFFLVVGLEIKRELVEGELSSLKKSFLPIAAALGGMIVPAIIYASINLNSESLSGWGIPMATDIAFALGVLSLLGNKVPFSLKIMLTALAIVDDLGAILVIGLFYSHGFSLLHFGIAVGIFAAMLGMNFTGIKNTILYLLLGVFLWYFTLKSGIHATISGVLIAFALPLGKGELNSAAEKLEHLLTKPVSFFVMPVFALANTGFLIDAKMVEALYSPVSYGVFFGLFIGKPIGITLFSWLSVKFNFASMPGGATWSQLLGIGFLGGIGYTMSIFVTLLAFNNPEFESFSKASILLASITAGITGFLMLRK